MCARFIDELLLPNRPKLNGFDLTTVKPDNVSNHMDVKGKIAEALVRQWLSRSGFAFDNSIPRAVGQFKLERTNGGIVVHEDKHQRCEFDEVAFYDRLPFIVQVKSGGLNGFSARVEDYLTVGRQIYGGDTQMLLFFPHYTNRQDLAIQVESQCPAVTCVDLGYKKKHMVAAVDRFMSRRY